MRKSIADEVTRELEAKGYFDRPPPRKVGRPWKKPKPGERRAQLSFRITTDMKRKLDAAAEKSGRSQSQEAELRLERSFDHDWIILEMSQMVEHIFLSLMPRK